MIDILLPTYNSEKFLSDQLDSIFKQSCSDFNLIIRDDGSKDSTKEITAQWQRRYPDRITVLQAEKNLGIVKGIDTLLQASSADYILFCDHDDIWLPEKINKTLARMKENEAKYGTETPILIHTDLTVTDRSLNTIGTFFGMTGINPSKNSLNRLLMQNTVTGCTAMINRALADKIDKIPDGAMVHDWWLAITASAFGRIDTVYEQTILYRQHGGNEIGAQKHSVNKGIEKGVKGELSRSLKNLFIQAEVFRDHYKENLSKENKEILSLFCRIPDMSPIMKRYTLLSNGFLKHGFTRNIGLMIYI